MQRAQFFYADSMSALATAISDFFIANAGFVGVSVSVVNREVGFEAILIYTP